MSEGTNITILRENNPITRYTERVGNVRVFADFNKAIISGIIVADFEYSHGSHWEKFYRSQVSVKRQSGVEDVIPIIVSEFLLEGWLKRSLIGQWVELAGTFRSYRQEGEHTRLLLFFFASAINFYEDCKNMITGPNTNNIYLEGYIVKPPVYRKTPLGKEVTDLLIAVSRTDRKSDYIPCIIWGKIARWARYQNVKTYIQL